MLQQSRDVFINRPYLFPNLLIHFDQLYFYLYLSLFNAICFALAFIFRFFSLGRQVYTFARLHLHWTRFSRHLILFRLVSFSVSGHRRLIFCRFALVSFICLFFSLFLSHYCIFRLICLFACFCNSLRTRRRLPLQKKHSSSCQVCHSFTLCQTRRVSPTHSQSYLACLPDSAIGCDQMRLVTLISFRTYFSCQSSHNDFIVLSFFCSFSLSISRLFITCRTPSNGKTFSSIFVFFRCRPAGSLSSLSPSSSLSFARLPDAFIFEPEILAVI